jgi:hypothetical protein
MRNLNLLAAVAATLLVGGTAIAKDEAPAGAPKEKKICKADQDSTSRITKKTCRTKTEWDQMAGQGNVDAAENKLRGISRTN